MAMVRTSHASFLSTELEFSFKFRKFRQCRGVMTRGQAEMVQHDLNNQWKNIVV
jgi:hypothetical protein